MINVVVVVVFLFGIPREWNKELTAFKKAKRKPSLARALIRIHGFHFILTACFPLVEELLKNIIQPLLFGWVLSYLMDPVDSPLSSYELFVAASIGIGLLNVVHAITSHPYNIHIQRIGEWCSLFR